MVCLFVFFIYPFKAKFTTLFYCDGFVKLMSMFVILSAIMTDKFMIVIDKSPAHCLSNFKTIFQYYL